MSELTRFLAGSTLHPQRPIPILTSSRIRLARNIGQEIFPERLSPQQREELKNRIIDRLKNLPEFKSFVIFEMHNLTLSEAGVLAERHLISKELVEREGAAVLISPDRKISIMINEEDHFRIQIVDTEMNLAPLSKTAESVTSAIAREFPFADSPRYGFLTACPTNLGTGMRVSVMMHLPGLVMDGEIEKVIRSLNMCGLTVRGSFGEGSDAAGSIFQISNQRTLDRSAEKIVENVQDWLKSLIEQERNARRRVVRRNRNVFLDQVGRLYGEFRFGILLSENEALTGLSIMRLACDLGIFPEYTRIRFDELLTESRDAHIYVRNKIAGTSKPNELADRCRATLFREAFATLPPPDFSRI